MHGDNNAVRERSLVSFQKRIVRHDVCRDKGRSWNRISNEAFHACDCGINDGWQGGWQGGCFSREALLVRMQYPAVWRWLQEWKTKWGTALSSEVAIEQPPLHPTTRQRWLIGASG